MDLIFGKNNTFYGSNRKNSRFSGLNEKNKLFGIKIKQIKVDLSQIKRFSKKDMNKYQTSKKIQAQPKFKPKMKRNKHYAKNQVRFPKF